MLFKVVDLRNIKPINKRDMKESEKYIVNFNPLACGMQDGGFTIKQNDDVKTPMAVVLCSVGANQTPKWKQQARDKADLLAMNPELINVLKDLLKCKGFDNIINHYPDLANRASRILSEASMLTNK